MTPAALLAELQRHRVVGYLPGDRLRIRRDCDWVGSVKREDE